MSGSTMLNSWRSFRRPIASPSVDDYTDEHECRSSVRLIDKQHLTPKQVRDSSESSDREERVSESHEPKNLCVNSESYQGEDRSIIEHDQPPVTSTASRIFSQKKSRSHKSKSSYPVHRLFDILRQQQEPHRAYQPMELERGVVTPIKLVTPLGLYQAHNKPVPSFDQQWVNTNWTNRQLDPLNYAAQIKGLVTQPTNRNGQQLASDLWHSERPVGTRLARPISLSDFVSSQGQRVLKNIANSTIAELVAQPVATAMRPLLGPQQLNLPLGPNAKYLPTMGRLYSFLFPNNPIQVGLANQLQASLHSSLTRNHSTGINGAPSVSPLAKEPLQSPSNKHQVYLSDARNRLAIPKQVDQKTQEVSSQQRQQGNQFSHSRQQPDRQQVINLSAPYDSRPRKLITSDRPQTSERSYDSSDNRVEEGESGSNRPRRGYRSSSLEPDGSTSHLLYDQHLTDAANGNEYQANIYQQPDTQMVEAGNVGPTNFEAVNLRQHEAAQAEDTTNPDQRKQEVIYAENGTAEADMPQDGDSLSVMSQYMQEAPYLGGNYGARKVVDKQTENIEEQVNNKGFKANSFKPSGLSELAGEQSEQAIPVGQDSSSPDVPEQPVINQETPYEHQDNQAIHQQLPDEEEEQQQQLAQVSVQNPNHEIVSIPGKQQVHQINPINEDLLQNEERENVSMFTRHVDDEQHRPDFQYSFANETVPAAPTETNDDSFLNLRLPSQYDATIRLPPEGYYDDYFKPASTNLAYHSSPNLSIHNPEILPEYPLGMSPNEQTSGPSQLQDQFEIEDNVGSRNTKGARAREQVRAADMPTSIDYMKHYFNNHPPSEQNESLMDSTVEYIPNNAKTNSTSASPNQADKPDSSVGKVDYYTPQVSRTVGGGGGATLKAEGGTFNYERGLVNKTFHGKKSPISDESTSIPNKSNANLHEDNIELIIANTNNSSRDPLSNEKLINYTSENGHNGTRQAGKPARNTFVNKEMNEFPPLVGEHTDNGQVGGQTTSSPTLQAANDDDGDSPIGQQQVRAPSLPENKLRRPASSPERQSETENDNGPSFPEDQMAGEEEDQFRRASTVPEGTTFGRYNKRGTNEPPRSLGGGSVRLFSASPEKMRQLRSSKQISLSKPPPHRPVREQRNTKQQQQPSRQRVNNHNYNHRQPEKVRSRDRREKQLQKGASSKQHSMRLRPQVTQVHLNPKNLIAIPPTAAPSSLNPVESIAELPSKVKKLRDNQPDKNELMNELLTALDRVKVAIYNLQPLTARMNAIYRKSVTSNTRDIIMDHHKGTYAKRYPPGDYDNVYDRMRPEDFIERQQQQQTDRRQTRSTQPSARFRSSADMILSGESAASAVYLPAPQEVIDKYKREIGRRRGNYSAYAIDHRDGSNLSEPKLVAIGIGSRLGDGRVRSTLSLSADRGRLRYDDDDEGGVEFGSLAAASTVAASRAAANTSEMSGDASADLPGPLFGYRITIYQSPSEDGDELDGAANNDQFSYQIEGGDEGSSFHWSTDSSPSNTSEVSKRSGGQDSADNDDDDDYDDAMVTSESSIAESHLALTGSGQPNSEQLGSNITSMGSLDQVTAESKGLTEKSEKKKKKKHSSEAEKKTKEGSKEEEDKKKEKSKKSHSKKAKGEEGKKKKKEYKKIKHKKGILSKEKKVLHRDKHIKAHDRGAAKEKALKERTQIEFFEREQIVDDEFEKGKKSMVKAGWQSGHDQKKSFKDSSGEQMSMGASHHVSHSAKDGVDSEKKHDVGSAASSGKKSNKFMKKDTEAKGKKFKGWREKGYKIITETEFIDRGSLHDSAYKKRDKGGAHHQKYKKHEAMSEGHHGSMHEEHKKSHKKEEKKANMHEKKAMKSKSAEHESKKSKDKKTQKKANKEKEKSGDDDDKDMSSNNVEPTAVQPHESSESTPKTEESPPDESTEESVQNLRKHRRSSQPIPVSGGSSSLRPSLSPSLLFSDNRFVNSRQQPGNSATLLRLLNANHDEDMPAKFARGDERSNVTLRNSSLPTSYSSAQLTNETVSSNPLRSLPQITGPNRHLPEHNVPSRLQHSLSGVQANRSQPSDLAPSHHQRQQVQMALQRQPNHGIITHPNESMALDKSNATILDIVDNLTGRQINKSKIGTYELEGHHMGTNETATMIRDGHIGANDSSSNRANNTMSRYVSTHNQPGGFTNTSSLGGRQHATLYRAPPGNHQPTQVPTVNRATVAARPQIVKNGNGPQAVNNNNVDGSLLFSLLQKATNTMQQVKQEPQPTVQPYGEAAAIQRPFNGDQANIYTQPLPNRNSEPHQVQQIKKVALVRQQQPPASQSPITAAHAEVAARLLQLVQSGPNQAMQIPNNRVSGQQQLTSGNLYDLSEHHRLANALNQRLRHTGYLQQDSPATVYHQQVPASRPSSLQMFTSPPPRQQPQYSQSSHNAASGNPSGQFGAEQLLDYELYPISQATHNFLAD